MASGAGFQMDAIKNLKDNRGLLKKTEAFDKIRNNKFIKAPEMKIEVPKDFYHDLKVIKSERIQKESRINQILIAIVSSIVAFFIIIFLYLSGK